MRQLIPLALVLVGCATAPALEGGWPTPPGVEQRHTVARIRMDDSIGYWADAFLEAAQGWRSLGVEVVLDDAAPRFVRCADTPIPGVMATNGAGIFAECDWLALPTVSDHLRAHAFAHEIGHFIGLQHVADPVALMYYESGESSPNAFTQDDVDEFFRVHPH